MTDAEQAAPVDIRVVGGDPTPEELAALTAVLTAAVEQLAGERRRRLQNRTSAWQRSQRATRYPMVRSWGTFGR